MAAQGGVEVEGLSRILRELKALGLEVDDLKDAFQKISTEAAEAVARHVPRGKTGRAAGAVRGNRAQSKAVVRAGSSAVPYLGVLNYGWPKRNIQPAAFMQKGEEEYAPKAVQRLEEEIAATIRQRGLR